MRRLFTAALAGALGVGALGVDASASNVTPLFQGGPGSAGNGNVHIGSDGNRQWILEIADPNVGLQTGDRIKGMFRWDSLTIEGNDVDDYNDNLSRTVFGVFQLEVSATDDVGGVRTVDFTADSSFVDPRDGGSLPTGTVGILYETDGTQISYDNLSNSSDPEDHLDAALATVAEQGWTFGFTGAGGDPGAGELWRSVIDTTDGEGDTAFALNVLNNADTATDWQAIIPLLRLRDDTGSSIGDLIAAGTVGSGSAVNISALLTGDANLDTNSPFGAHGQYDFLGTNTNTRFNIVPLPAAAWAGLGLLGVLGAGRGVRRLRDAG